MFQEWSFSAVKGNTLMMVPFEALCMSMQSLSAAAETLTEQTSVLTLTKRLTVATHCVYVQEDKSCFF